MKKELLLLVCLVGFGYSLIAQNTSKWEIDLNYTYQFDLNEKETKVISSNQDLHQYGISIKRILIDQNRFQLLGGLGYSRQQILGYVGINHCYLSEFCNKIALSRKNYTLELAEVPLSVRFAITNKWSVDLTALPQFRFHQNYDYNFDRQSKSSFELNAIAIYPSVSYQYQKWRFSLGSRLMNWQQPDETFGYDHSFLEENPDFYEQELYAYNPFQLKFSVAAQF